MSQEIKKLFEGVDGLSADFLAKVQAVLNTQVEAARTAAIQETLESHETERLALIESHQAELAQQAETLKLEMETKLSAYLDQVVIEWANTHAPAIDAKIKSEAAERLISGLTNVMKESRIHVIEDRDGALAAAQSRLAETENRLNLVQSQLALVKEEEENRLRESVIAKVSAGLADTQIETLNGLCEGVKFESEAQFSSRVRVLRNLLEGKKAKKEGDDSDEDNFKDNVGKDDEVNESKKKAKKEGDDSDDDDDDDKDDDKDEAGKEMNEAIKRLARQALKG